MVRLQWGHGESAVDNISAVPTTVSASWLQWGHGESAVDNDIDLNTILVMPFKLQWGHGESAVDNGE